MDRSLRTAVRHVMASGKSVELFENLVEDASLTLLQEFEEVLQRGFFLYRSRRILRALGLPGFQLRHFQLKVGEKTVPVQKCIRDGNRLIFTALYISADPAPIYVSECMLIDDEGYEFTPRPLGQGLTIMNGDTLKLDYTLDVK